MGAGQPKHELELVYEGSVFFRYLKYGCVRCGQPAIAPELAQRLFQSLEHQPLEV